VLSPHPGGVALVLAAHTDRWLVAREDAAADADPVLVAARGRLRDDAVTGPPVTGDRVVLDEGGAIAQVLPRRGTIVRRAAGEPTAAQVLAANVDLALVVEPFPDPNARRAERFAALASAGGVEAALVLSKADLDPAAQETAARLARRVGVLEGIAVSAHDGDGVTAISALLTAGKTAVLLGP
jgi:ribosome biogenesis GTPase